MLFVCRASDMNGNNRSKICGWIHHQKIKQFRVRSRWHWVRNENSGLTDTIFSKCHFNQNLACYPNRRGMDLVLMWDLFVTRYICDVIFVKVYFCSAHVAVKTFFIISLYFCIGSILLFCSFAFSSHVLAARQSRKFACFSKSLASSDVMAPPWWTNVILLASDNSKLGMCRGSFHVVMSCHRTTETVHASFKQMLVFQVCRSYFTQKLLRRLTYRLTVVIVQIFEAEVSLSVDMTGP